MFYYFEKSGDDTGMTGLKPLCPECGFELVAKIGSEIIVCVLCSSEFELIKKLNNRNEFSQKNLEMWK